MILDGEAVIFGDLGRSDFAGCSSRSAAAAASPGQKEAIFIAFDMPYPEGHDVARMPLFDRRRTLDVLPDEVGLGAICFSEDIGTDGASLLKFACAALGLETRPYRPGVTVNGSR
jgi:bifunctional non-homologous end joining protein LigD